MKLLNKKTSFTIGKVTGVHGLGGNIKVWSFAESEDTFSQGASVLLKFEEEKGKLYTILKVLPHKKGVILHLNGVDNRELAEELVGKEILIDRGQLPEPDEDTWFWQDLIGLDVIDHQRGFIGKVTDIFPTGSNDVLVVTDETRETLVPMHKNFVDTVDLDKMTMTITLPQDY